MMPLLASRYDVAFAPEENGTDVEEKLADQFTACPGRLRLVFSKREQ